MVDKLHCIPMYIYHIRNHIYYGQCLWKCCGGDLFREIGLGSWFLHNIRLLVFFFFILKFSFKQYIIVLFCFFLPLIWRCASVWIQCLSASCYFDAWSLNLPICCQFISKGISTKVFENIWTIRGYWLTLYMLQVSPYLPSTKFEWRSWGVNF